MAITVTAMPRILRISKPNQLGLFSGPSSQRLRTLLHSVGGVVCPCAEQPLSMGVYSQPIGKFRSVSWVSEVEICAAASLIT